MWKDSTAKDLTQHGTSMACRKAAYRAQVELSEWMEKQQETAAEVAAEMEREQRQIWTPSHVLDECCLPWLVHGHELSGRRSTASSGSIRNHRGCSGACGKDHVRITLAFESETQQGTAILSHALDPLLRYFDALCQQGLACRIEAVASSPTITNVKTATDTEKGPVRFLLYGSLEAHVKRIQNLQPSKGQTSANSAEAQQQQQQQQQQRACFGYHLVKVSGEALTASKRAYERQEQQRELERQTKRQKIWKSAVAPPHLLESVLDIFCHDSKDYFLQHLTLADLAWMRQLRGSETMTTITHNSNHEQILGLYAARMAEDRLKRIRLSYSVLLGCDQTIRTDGRGPRPIVQDEHCVFTLGDGSHKYEYFYVVKPRVPLVLRMQSSQQACRRSTADSCSMGCFVPERITDFRLTIPSDDDDEDMDLGGAMIRIYLEPDPDVTNLPERDCLFTAPLEIARCRIRWNQLPSLGQSGQPIEELTLSNMAVQVSSSRVHNQDLASYPTREALTGVPARTEHDRHCDITLQSFQFGFDDLVGIYVRKKLPLAKKHLQQIKTTRAVRPMEKEYVKALAKAVREAPGSADAFAGWLGW